MSWNPNSGIGMFEPGCIKCQECGQKPDDSWDDAPKGFTFTRLLGWVCEECETELALKISEDL